MQTWTGSAFEVLICDLKTPRTETSHWYSRDGGRGRSSGVKHNLAKVGVAGSNPIARSNCLPHNAINSWEPREPPEAAG